MSDQHTAVLFQNYLRNFQVKEQDETKPFTNTRIGNKDAGIWGGSYHIPEIEYSEFVSKYISNVVENNVAEHLTEVQLKNGGPILVDMDFRFAPTCTTRLYDRDCIDDIIALYCDELKKIYQFDETSEFKVFVLEKSKINPVPEKGIVKDGLHFIFGISAERKAQILLRKAVLEKIGDMLSHLPITNSWTDVLDEGITNGGTNWQMYGSAKPLHEPYRLTLVYKMKYDASDGDFECEVLNTHGQVSAIRPYLSELSARYAHHPSFFYTSAFMRVLEENPGLGEIKPRARSPARMRGGDRINADNIMVANARNIDELLSMRDQWLESITSVDYMLLYETYEYVMSLPESFYGAGSYNNWMRVGWALRNTDDRLFIVWAVFSAQSASFSFADLPDLLEKWNTFDHKNPHGLHKESILYWVKEHAPQRYAEIRLSSVDYKIEQQLGKVEYLTDDKKRSRSGCGDYDIAEVLATLKKGEYKCVSVKNNIWYRYSGTYWTECDSGTPLRKCISTELREIYSNKASKYMEKKALFNETDHPDQLAQINKNIDKLLDIVERLGRTTEKKNIMTEARDMFWDPDFEERLDANPYLLCFKNGVVDFKEKVFRKGLPEDYLSKCTGYDYVPLNRAKHAPVIAEIEKFLHEIMPIKEMYDYLWDHLASSLIGVAGQQKFHMFIGAGSNGKSLLMGLMEKVLGSYFQTVALSIITGQRAKVGGTSPELIALKGVRYAVMQEPDKDERINVGIMKNLTSGIDPIQARGLYQPKPLTFMPQFKLVLCSNEFMKIDTQDHGTWRRIAVVDFLSKFCDKPVHNDPTTPYQFKMDENLVNRLDGWKQVMVAMLVEHAYQMGGKLRECKYVVASSDKYREKQDYISEFIADRIVLDPEGTITKPGLTFEFKMWYESTYGRGGPAIKEVQTYMDRKFQKCNETKVWLGVRFGTSNTKRQVDDSDVSSVEIGDL